MNKADLQTRIGLFGIALAFVLLPFVYAEAAANSNAAAEIDHLLGFIATSSCRFERNSTEYSGAEAVKHIKKKYDHFKDRIDSAEAFIAYSATKSTMSGKAYMIHCGSDDAITSSDWLHAALDTYRAGPN